MLRLLTAKPSILRGLIASEHSRGAAFPHSARTPTCASWPPSHCRQYSQRCSEVKSPRRAPLFPGANAYTEGGTRRGSVLALTWAGTFERKNAKTLAALWPALNLAGPQLFIRKTVPTAPTRWRCRRISAPQGQSPPSPGCPPAPLAWNQTYPLHPSTSPFSKLLAAVNKVPPFLSPQLETRRKGICRPEPSLYRGHEGRLREAASLAEVTVSTEEELGQDQAREVLLCPVSLEIRPRRQLAKRRKGAGCGPNANRQLCLPAVGGISTNPERPN